MTGRTFYPDMLMKANFRECEIVTVARVLNEEMCIRDRITKDNNNICVYERLNDDCIRLLHMYGKNPVCVVPDMLCLLYTSHG